MKRTMTNPGEGINAATNGPGVLRVEDCELRFQNGEMSVTFRLSLFTPAATPRRVPPRPTKSRP